MQSDSMEPEANAKAPMLSGGNGVQTTVRFSNTDMSIRQKVSSFFLSFLPSFLLANIITSSQTFRLENLLIR